MRKHIVADVGGTRVNVAWLSLQPDGSVSFGLRDKAYVSARHDIKVGIWNAYNRVRISFVNPSNRDALLVVTNPHFTFHPINHFHLRADGDDKVFQGIADVPIVLQQDGRMPWIRATSAPLRQLSYRASRADSIDVEEWIMPAPTADASILVEVDLIRPNEVGMFDNLSRKSVCWHDVGVRVTAAFTWPQVATLSWFHFY